MSALERWQRLEVLFHQAIERPPERRAAFIEDACEDDADLCAELLDLLAAHAEPDDFFEASPLSFALDTQVEGQRIGPYRLVRVLGRGGMGTVYLAEDAVVKRPVALKVIRTGLDTEDVRRRFERERRILAALDHEGIARLYGGGVTEEGRPYFVMEHVEGDPIDVYCDRERLDVAARLELFRAVCRAVQHAHQRLVVHRDLKPSNVLVATGPDGAPVVKLLDFGIAKILAGEADEGLSDATAPPITRADHPLMTPEYAAPEQVRGDPITTSTDVYALGVLLYELLTGHRPYRLPGRVRRAVEHAILETAPTRPSTVVDTESDRVRPEQVAQHRATTLPTLRRSLRGDLDEITLKTLRKEPAQRYASAEALADDLRRYLAGEAVEARGGAWRYRASRFVRRHRYAVATGAALVLALVAGFGTALWQAGIAQDNASAARLEAAKQAEMKRFVLGLFATVDPSDVSYDTLSVRALLDDGARSIPQRLGDQPEVQAEMLVALGDIYRRLADYEAADSLLRRALELTPATGTAKDTVRAEYLNVRASLLEDRAAYERAAPLLREALALHLRYHGPDHAATARSYAELGLHLWRTGRYDSAAIMHRRALAFHRARTPLDTAYLSSSLNNLGMALWYGGADSAVVPLFREALALRAAFYGPDHPRLGALHVNLGSLYRSLGLADSAAYHYQRALTIRREALGPDHPRTASALHAYGVSLLDASHADEAAAALTEALAVRRATLGEHPETAESLRWLAHAESERARHAEAEALAREAVAMNRRVFGRVHDQTGSALEALAHVLRQAGRREAAAERYREAIGVLTEALGPDHPATQHAQRELAEMASSD